jgi:hypothetical protein
MTKLLIIAASFSLAASAAFACDIHDMHTAGTVDETKVASVASGDEQKMSVPETAPTTSTLIVDQQKAEPADTE